MEHKQKRKNFNADQKSTRACIENAFGILKKRWRCLHNGLECRLRNSAETVWACMVLHNICIAQGDIWSNYNHKKDKDKDIGWKKPAWLVITKNAAQQSADQPPTRSNDNAAKAARERLVLTHRLNHRRKRGAASASAP